MSVLTAGEQRCTPHVDPGYSSADLRALGMQTPPAIARRPTPHELSMKWYFSSVLCLYQKREVNETCMWGRKSTRGPPLRRAYSAASTSGGATESVAQARRTLSQVPAESGTVPRATSWSW